MCRLSICTSKWPLRLISLVSVRLRKDPDGHAGDWLLVTPSEPRLRLANEEFRFASKLRLGLPIAHLPDRCPCSHRNHDSQTDLGLGYHSLTCRHRRLTWFIPRHNWLLRTWSRIFKAAGFSYDEEPPGLFAQYQPEHAVAAEAEAHVAGADPHKENQLRPDHQVFDFAGSTLLTDVSVTFSRISQGSNVDAVAIKESFKIGKYGDAIRTLALGHLFRPLVVDCFGRWGKHAVSVMNTCASHCLHGKKFSCPRFFKRHHWRLLSVTIMRALCHQCVHYQNNLPDLGTDAAAIVVDVDALARARLAEHPEDDVFDLQ